MRNLFVVGIVSVFLMSCGDTKFTDLIDKAQELEQQSAEKLAVAFNGYCEHTPGVVRDRLRDNVNAELEKMGSPWRAADFCAKD